MVLVRDELKFWGLAGTCGISYLIALAPEKEAKVRVVGAGLCQFFAV
jgi:hypothetical protein